MVKTEFTVNRGADPSEIIEKLLEELLGFEMFAEGTFVSVKYDEDQATITLRKKTTEP